MARLIPQVPGMCYAHDDENLYVTFYAESATTAEVGGTTVAIEQETAYPNEGEIEVALNPEKPASFNLALRIPTWAQNDRFVPGDLYQFVDGIKEMRVRFRPSGSRGNVATA